MLVKLIYAALMGAQIGLILKRPAALLGLGISVYAVAFWSASLDPFFAKSYGVTNVTFVLIGLFAVAIHIQREGFSDLFKIGPAAWLLVSLLVLSFASVFWSISTDYALEQFGKTMPKLLAFSILLPIVLARPSQIHFGLVVAAIFSGVVLWLYMAMAFTSGRWVVSNSGQSFGNPLAIASLGGVVAIIGSTVRVRRVGTLVIPIRIGLVILGLSAIIFVDTRGQLIAAGIVILTVTPLAIGGTNFKALAGKVLVPILFIVPTALVILNITSESARFDPLNMIQEYGGSRLVFVKLALQYWVNAGPAAWLIGIGSTACFSPEVVGFYPHFVIVEVLVELGLLGLAIWLTALGLTVRSGLRLLRVTAAHPEYRSAIAALGGLFLFYFILSFKQGSLLGSHELAFMMILVSRMDTYGLQRDLESG